MNFYHTRNTKKGKKGITEVVAVIALLSIVVVVGAFVYRWGINFTNSNLEQGSINQEDLTVNLMDTNTLYVKSQAGIDFNYTGVKINGKECNLSGRISGANLTKIDLDFCMYGMNKGPKEITLYSNKGVFSYNDYLDTSFMQGFYVQQKTGTTCDIGYTKIYGMESVSNSHIEIASSGLYTYSICLKHLAYSLSNSCSGVYGRVFYLDNVTNAHAYTDNSSAYGSISTWEEACISAGDGASEVDVV